MICDRVVFVGKTTRHNTVLIDFVSNLRREIAEPEAVIKLVSVLKKNVYGRGTYIFGENLSCESAPGALSSEGSEELGRVGVKTSGGSSDARSAARSAVNAMMARELCGKAVCVTEGMVVVHQVRRRGGRRGRSWSRLYEGRVVFGVT